MDPGFLPIYSVDTEEEAEELLTLACSRNMHGQFIARELAEEQTLDNLYAFGERLEKSHDMLKQAKLRRRGRK